MTRRFCPVETKYKKLAGEPLFPVRKTTHSAGYDFLAPMDIKIKPKAQKLIWTDIKAEMEEDEFLMVQIRSSLGVKYGVVLANGTGIIDADYYGNIGNDGNIGIALKNTSKIEVCIPKGEGIAQGIFLKYLKAENCNDGEVRGGGFGSTNK
jgi:dUTP pyrophosphatase